jgi:argininosuccinate lyase
MRVKHENMRNAALRGFTTATDLADYLVGKGVPFRDAHEIVGKSVRYCVENRCSLESLSLELLQSFSDLIQADVHAALTLEGSIAARNHVGGTAPVQVRAAIQRLRSRL